MPNEKPMTLEDAEKALAAARAAYDKAYEAYSALVVAHPKARAKKESRQCRTKKP
jgi:hypothetical protein